MARLRAEDDGTREYKKGGNELIKILIIDVFPSLNLTSLTYYKFEFETHFIIRKEYY